MDPLVAYVARMKKGFFLSWGKLGALARNLINSLYFWFEFSPIGGSCAEFSRKIDAQKRPEFWESQQVIHTGTGVCSQAQG